MKLFVKNMVCPRCIMSVEQILKENGLQPKSVQLGEVELLKEANKKTIAKAFRRTAASGF